MITESFRCLFKFSIQDEHFTHLTLACLPLIRIMVVLRQNSEVGFRVFFLVAFAFSPE